VLREEPGPAIFRAVSEFRAMIFVWATCSAGIAKSPPWPPDLAIQRERLAETKTNAEFRMDQALKPLTKGTTCQCDARL